MCLSSDTLLMISGRPDLQKHGEERLAECLRKLSCKGAWVPSRGNTGSAASLTAAHAEGVTEICSQGPLIITAWRTSLLLPGRALSKIFHILGHSLPPPSLTTADHSNLLLPGSSQYVFLSSNQSQVRALPIFNNFLKFNKCILLSLHIQVTVIATSLHSL